MSSYRQPVHTIGVDKNDYRRALESRWMPAEHWAKDYVRKLYAQKHPSPLSGK